MHVTNIISRAATIIDVQEDDGGEIHKYVRIEPYFWVWISSSWSTGQPMLKIIQLEEKYREFLQAS